MMIDPGPLIVNTAGVCKRRETEESVDLLVVRNCSVTRRGRIGVERGPD